MVAPEPRRFRTLFLSDVHLGSKAAKADFLIDFLRHHEADHIYLVGDIIDGWRLKRSWHWPQAHNDVVQKLLRQARKGARITYVAGNHDEFLRGFQGTHFGGIEVVDRAIHEAADGRRYLVIHGDQFDAIVHDVRWLAYLGDRAYDLALITNRLVAIVRRALGRPYWSFSSWAKANVKKAVNFIGNFRAVLIQEARRENVDGIICGHIHHAEIARIEDVDYINTGDWVESCTAVVEHSDGHFEIIAWTVLAAIRLASFRHHCQSPPKNWSKRPDRRCCPREFRSQPYSDRLKRGMAGAFVPLCRVDRNTMTLPPLSADQQVKPRRFELRMSLMYSTLFLAPGIHLPYFPIWLDDAGFDAAQIAVILSVPMFTRMATTPYITAHADRAGERVNVLLVVIAASFALSLGFFLTPTYAAILAVSTMLAIVWTPHVLIVDSIALSGVRRYGSDYSRMRVWGSSSFLAANVVGGMILAATGPGAVPLMISSGMITMLAMATLLPRLGRPRVASALSATGLQQVAPSLLNKPFVLFVAGAGIVNASHGFQYGFVSIYWKSIGLSEATVGALWAWSVLAEVLLFFAFTRVFGKTPASRLVLYAGLAAMLRWLALPLILPVGLGVPGYFAIQTLHALSTGLILIGVQKMIAEAVPENRTGAAQGIAFFANGLSMAAVTLASGPIYASYGVGGFFVMVVIAALGAGLVIAGSRHHPQRSGEGGETRDPV